MQREEEEPSRVYHVSRKYIRLWKRVIQRNHVRDLLADTHVLAASKKWSSEGRVQVDVGCASGEEDDGDAR